MTVQKQLCSAWLRSVMPKVGVLPFLLALLVAFVGMSLSLVFVFFTAGATHPTKVSTSKYSTQQYNAMDQRDAVFFSISTPMYRISLLR